MNITVNSQLLAVELRALNKIVPTKPTLDIFSHTLVTAIDDVVHFYATDHEVALNTSCACRIEIPGIVAVAVPVEKLLQMVEQFPDAEVNLSLDKGQVVVKCVGFTSRLCVLPASGFPEQPIVQGTESTIDAVALRTLIAYTRHAIPTDATKYLLKGALLTCSANTAAMVATDSKRLALAQVKSAGSNLEVILPTKVVDLLFNSEDNGTITVTVGERHLFFAVNNRLLTSRMLEGTFPKYQRIIPRDNDKKVVAERTALIAALRRVVLAADDNCVLAFDISNALLEMSSTSRIGSAYEALQVSYAGEALRVFMNGNYLLDFLNASESETVTIELKDEKTAALISGGNDHSGIIMLMRG